MATPVVHPRDEVEQVCKERMVAMLRGRAPLMAPIALRDGKGHLAMAGSAVLARSDGGHGDRVFPGLGGKGGGMAALAGEPGPVGGVREDDGRKALGPRHDDVGGIRGSLEYFPCQGGARGDETSPQGVSPVHVASRVPGEVLEERSGLAIPRRIPLDEVAAGAVDGLPRNPSVVTRHAERFPGRHPLHQDLVRPRLHPEDGRVADLAGILEAMRVVRKDRWRNAVLPGRLVHLDIAIECSRIWSRPYQQDQRT